MIKLIRKSLYSPEFYRSLLDKPLSFSLRYFFSFIIGLSIVVTAVFSFTLVPDVRNFVKDLAPAMISYYPDELIISIRDGRASVNVSEPYLIPMPEKLSTLKEYISGFGAANLLVIDTKTEFSLADYMEKFEAYDTFLLLTQKNVMYWQGDGKDPEVQSLKNFPNMTITKDLMRSFSARLRSALTYLIPLMIFGIFGIMMVSYTFQLLYLFLAALLVWLIARVRGVSIGYLKAYQIGIHAMTLGIIVKTFFLIALWPRPKAPFLFTALLLIVVLVNVKSSPERYLPKGWTT